jgi:hypothetical protein
MTVVSSGWIRACGWIRCIMVHKSHPGAPIHPDLFAAERLTMHVCTSAPAAITHLRLTRLWLARRRLRRRSLRSPWPHPPAGAAVAAALAPRPARSAPRPPRTWSRTPRPARRPHRTRTPPACRPAALSSRPRLPRQDDREQRGADRGADRAAEPLDDVDRAGSPRRLDPGSALNAAVGEHEDLAAQPSLRPAAVVALVVAVIAASQKVSWMCSKYRVELSLG